MKTRAAVAHRAVVPCQPLDRQAEPGRVGEGKQDDDHDRRVKQEQDGGEIADGHDAEHRHAQARDPRADRHVPYGVTAGQDDGVGTFWPFAKDAAVLPLRH